MIGLFGLLGLAVAQEPISAEALATHGTEEDCWIAIAGQVYDLTEFIPGHPGGSALVQACGTDGTRAFYSRPSTGDSHSMAAEGLLASYRIGTLTGAAPTAEIPTWRVLDPMRMRTGVVAPTGVIVGANQLHFDFAHHFHFPATPQVNSRLSIGWGIGNRADVLITHATWSGESGGQVRLALAQQEGRRKVGSLERGAKAPLTVMLQVAGGFRVEDTIPDEERGVVTGQLILERTFGPASIALSPGMRITDQIVPFGTLVLDLRPHRTGGLFAEAVLAPLGGSVAVRFSGGLRAYTRAHAFSLYGGMSPSLAPGEAASPIGGGGFGFSFSRRFPFAGG